MKVKFSIIVPVYNVEKYLEKCLDSIINQTFDDYEVILVCDKSNDNSEKIVDNYIKDNKKFKKYYYENTGLAKAKNIGVSKSNGEYIIFLDSDDYIENDFLETLIKKIKGLDDITRIQARVVNESYELIKEYNEKPFTCLNSKEAFEIIKTYHFVENSWLYIYKLSFWKENNFTFLDGYIAEDYGLTPLILSKAKSISSLNYIGYNYVQRPNSLMNESNYDRKLSKFKDMLEQRNRLEKELSNENYDNIMCFLDDSLIYYITTLNKTDFIKLTKVLSENKALNKRNCNIKRNIKLLIIKYSPLLYYLYKKVRNK